MAHLGPSLRRQKRTERPLRRAAAAVVASLALNALLLWALAAAGAFRLPTAAVDRTRVALAPLSSAQWDANRAVAGSQRPAAPSPPAPEERPAGRVVELSPDQKASSEPPPNAKFLSDRNTRVEKETVSRHADNRPRVALRPEAGAEGKASAAAPAPKRNVQPGGQDTGAPGREGAPGDRVAMARPQGELRMPELGEGGERGRRGKAGPDLSVSREALARIAGGPSMDGVGEGLPEGEETWLQAREFKYATFMNRFKSEVAQQWIPRVRDAQRQRDPDGSLFFYRERTVVLGITMDTDGNVKDLAVMQSSNVDFFDRLAVASVRAAQPFPNPPRGMFHGDGEVRFPFGFTMFPGDRRGIVFWRPPSEP
ncbi:MAG TPA: energy transducer TonB [Anaeromyxobacter sp.]